MKQKGTNQSAAKAFGSVMRHARNTSPLGTWTTAVDSTHLLQGWGSGLMMPDA